MTEAAVYKSKKLDCPKQTFAFVERKHLWHEDAGRVKRPEDNSRKKTCFYWDLGISFIKKKPYIFIQITESVY